MTPSQAERHLGRPEPSSLAEAVDTILDKGLIIDAWMRGALLGVDLTIDSRCTVASVDTYLRFAETVDRLLVTQTQGRGVPDRRTPT
jgi:gas vesicle structural protein